MFMFDRLLSTKYPCQQRVRLEKETEFDEEIIVHNPYEYCIK